MRSWLMVVLGAAILGRGGAAGAGIEDWEVNEVVTQVGGDVQIRYIELRNLPGGCMFPTTRIVAYDAAGQNVGSINPVVGTTCWGPDTYMLFATTAAQTSFDTGADRSIVPALPVDAGQVCFTSSATRYDCVRWGTIATPVHDFFGASDDSTVAAPASGTALARIATTHVIADDWVGLAPTPRGPNDGTPWSPPDAGPVPDAGPDAGVPIDAAPTPDAFIFPDAGQRLDARSDRYLDLTPRGAGCGCSGSGGGGRGSLALLLVALVAALRPATRRR